MAGDLKRFQTAMTHAERFSQQQQWADAIKAYRYALGEFPNNEAAIIGFGKASLFSGQVDFAGRAFQQALKINPTNPEALVYIGNIQEQKGETDAAAETYLRIGNMHASKMNVSAAVEFWERATQLVPTQTAAHRRLADGLAQQGQTRPAARQFLRLAGIYQQQGNRDQAMQQIHSAEQLLADDPGIAAAYEALHNNALIEPDLITDTPPPPEPLPDFFSDTFAEPKATSRVEEDPFAIGEEANIASKGLLETFKDSALAELADLAFSDDSDLTQVMLIVQAIDLQSKGNLAEAAKNYQQAVQGGVQKSALFFNLGVLWKELGQIERAIEMLNRSAQDNKYGLGTQFALGETYQGANKLDLALRHFFDLVKQVDLKMVPTYQAQQLAQHYGNLINTYLAERDTKKINVFISAVKNFFSHPAWEKKAFDARQIMDGVRDNGMMSLAEYLETPETEVVINAMALTTQYMNRNLLMTASEECLRAIQRVPSYLPLHVRLADILLKQDHIDEAITKYMSIAKVYEMRGTPEEAIDVYHKVLHTAPMDVTILAALIDIYTARQDVEKALEHYLILARSYYTFAQVDRALEKYNEALRLANNSSNSVFWKVEILQKIGDIYTQRFDWARATAAYEQINQIKSGDVEIQRKLIDLYYKQGKTNQAVTMLDQLLSFYERQNPLKTVEILKDFSGNRPEDMALRQRLAVAYVQNGLNKEAITEYDALGEMQLEQGLRDQAIQTIQAIVHLGPEDIEGYRRLLNQIKGR